MIKILDKHQCCGCEACAQSCPKQCISMQEDMEGFLYPSVQLSLCIDCGACERVCPISNSIQPIIPIESFAAKSTNEELRKSSSSGGIFSELAQYVIKKRGVVFGASFNSSWEVYHSHTEDVSGISVFRGSKYVQSRIGNAFSITKSYLIQGRLVLFSGTPCQIAGLKKYLKSDYSNLITVEVACHGVPSPRVWREYLQGFSNIVAVRFRDKLSGWRNYTVSIECLHKTHNTLVSKNSYMKSFLSNYNIRPSCYQCAFKNGKSESDITLADYWGIWNYCPELDDDKGVSAILVNTPLGKSILDVLDLCLIPAPFSQIIENNPSIVFSTSEPINRFQFWEEWNAGHHKRALRLCSPLKDSLFKRIIKHIK